MMEIDNIVDYERALHMTGFGRYNMLNFLTCNSAAIAATIELYSMTILTSASSCELETTSSQQSLMNNLIIMGMFLTCHNWGLAADVKGRRLALLIAMAGNFLSNIFAAFSPHWIMLIVFKVICAGLVGSVYPISQVWLAECTPVTKRHSMTILSTSALLLGYGLISVIPIPILSLSFSYHIPLLNIQFNSWRLLSLTLAIPSALSAVVIYHTEDSPKYYLSEKKQGESIEILRKMYVVNTGKHGDGYKVDALDINEKVLTTELKTYIKTYLGRTLPMMKKPMGKYTQLITWLYSVAFVSMMLLVTWPGYIVSVFMASQSNGDTHLTVCQMIKAYQNVSNVEISQGPVSDCKVDSVTMSISFGVCMILAISNVFVSGLVNYITRRNLLLWIQVIAGLALVGVNASPYWMLTSALFIIYLMSISSYGIITTYVNDLYPTYMKAVVLCLFLVMSLSQGKFFAALVAKLLQNHCEYVFFLYGSIAWVGVLLCNFLPSEQKIMEIIRPEEEKIEEEEKELQGDEDIRNQN